MIRACHPGPTAVVTLIAVLLGVRFNLPAGQLALVGVTVLVGQLSIGWSNDWLDAERDRSAARLDKPVVSDELAPERLMVAAVSAGVTAVPLSLAAGWWPGACHLLLVASGWIYNAWLKPTVVSPVPYAIGFGALPAYVALVGDRTPQWWLVLSGAGLGVAAHFANAAPDVEHDRALGVLGAPQRIGSERSLMLSLALLALVGVTLAWQIERSAAVSVLVAAAVLTPVPLGVHLLRKGKQRQVFRLVMAAAVLDVGLLVVVG